MKTFEFARACLLWLCPLLAFSQDNITIHGTPIPRKLVEQNYGKMPKNVGAYDLSICNVSDQRQTVVSSRVYQALAESNIALSPLGRQIILAAILKNESRSPMTLLGVGLNSATGMVALLSASKSTSAPNGLMTALGLTTVLLGQVINQLKPVLGPDRLEKFESQVLETALALDSGSCVERTVFTLASDKKAKAPALQFRMK